MMSMREWVEQYRLANEWEQRERLERLPREAIEESIRGYFKLSQLMQAASRSTDEATELQLLRAEHYLGLIGKWQRLARQQAKASTHTLEEPEKEQHVGQA